MADPTKQAFIDLQTAACMAVSPADCNVFINLVCWSMHIHGLVQDCSVSSALAMGLLHSCTKPSICD